MDEYEIEKDIPIPPVASNQKTAIRLTMESMSVGDSFILASKKEYEQMRHTVVILHKTTEHQFTYRRLKTSDGQAMNAWRVWRVK